MIDSRSIPYAFLRRGLLAIALTLGLLVFLVITRISRHSQTPVLTLRSLETSQPVSLPAPPVATESERKPPPAPNAEPAKLDIEFDPLTPLIQVSPKRAMELNVEPVDFSPQVEEPRGRMVFSAKNLDSQPTLITRSAVSFPQSLRDRGIVEGRVTLEVVIRPNGKASVRRVIDCSHPEFIEMAQLFATGSRFTPPRKDGRAVTALFKWPLILRP